MTQDTVGHVSDPLHVFIQVTDLAFDTSSCAVRLAVFQVMHIFFSSSFIALKVNTYYKKAPMIKKNNDSQIVNFTVKCLNSFSKLLYINLVVLQVRPPIYK